jgi:hypothetical protein
VLASEDHVVVRRPGIDRLASGTLVVGVIDRPQSDLAPVALIPLIVLAAARWKCDGLLDGSLGLCYAGGHDVVFCTLAAVSLPESCEFLGRACQVRMGMSGYDHVDFGLCPAAVRGKKSCGQNQPDDLNSTSDF